MMPVLFYGQEVCQLLIIIIIIIIVIVIIIITIKGMSTCHAIEYCHRIATLSSPSIIKFVVLDTPFVSLEQIVEDMKNTLIQKVF